MASHYKEAAGGEAFAALSRGEVALVADELAGAVERVSSLLMACVRMFYVFRG